MKRSTSGRASKGRGRHLAGGASATRALSHALSRALGLVVLGVLLSPLFAGGAIAAQGPGLTGFANNPDAPIQIESDRLDVADKKGTATFVGNVIVVQGKVRMSSDRLTVYYASKQGSGGNRIERIRATGNVHVSAPDQQSASGNWAEYEVATRRINMGDSVVLRQGKNVIRGTKLFVDLNSGESRVVGSKETAGSENGANGRVRGLFQPPQEGQKQ